ncbi:hypothetical protein [Pseudogulbenkiania sp. MAI-1]|uniref:hypothetical protein n=1 Tax=Pseudogulbenkiania sp. MAI-1 TaxID=990370 RepID=UPI00045E984E|nr:hypothetical protein [Pseudogulbenkiania sp. MAI-1]
MTLLRKHLPLLCGLLAALWLFFASAGMLGACLGPLAAVQGEEVASVAVQPRAGHGHDGVQAHSAGLPDRGERLTCAKLCADDLGGVLKPPSLDSGQFAILALAVLCFVRPPFLPAAAPVRRVVGALFAAIGTPPPTIRFHRFNN